MAAMLKLKSKTPGWSRPVAQQLCVHCNLHHATLSSAMSRIYVPPPSIRTQWRGDSAAAQTCPWQEGCCSLATPLPPGRATAAPVFSDCITSSNYSAAPQAWIFMLGSTSHRITYKPSYMAESLFPHQERKNFDAHLFFSYLSLQVSDLQCFTAINCDPQLLVAICFQLPPSEKSEWLPPFFSPPLSDA